MLALGCLVAGVPYVPVSPPYSLVSQDLRQAAPRAQRPLTPGLVLAADARTLCQGHRRPRWRPGSRWCCSAAPDGRRRQHALRSWPRHRPTAAGGTRAMQATGPDTIVKFLFTTRLHQDAQGGDQHPAHVVRQPAADARSPCRCCRRSRRCWSTGCRGTTPSAATTTSASRCYHGGTLYIDDGKPTPALMHETLRNLREIAPTVYFNVPDRL